MPGLSSMAVAISRKLFPKSTGPRGLSIAFDCTTLTSAEVYVQLSTQGLGDFIGGLFVDNSANLQAAIITIGGTNQIFYIPAQSQADLTLFAFAGQDNVKISCATTGGVVVPAFVTNVDGSNTVYASTAPGQIVGAVTVNGTVNVKPVAGIPTDASATIAAGGVSQLVQAANVNRQRILLYNPATPASQGIANVESLFLNFGGAATVNAPGSFEILPGGYFDTGSGACPSSTINLIGATTGHIFICKTL